jgi:hypothetical protein
MVRGLMRYLISEYQVVIPSKSITHSQFQALLLVKMYLLQNSNPLRLQSLQLTLATLLIFKYTFV